MRPAIGTLTAILALAAVASSLGAGSAAAQDLAPQTVAALCRGCHRDKFDALALTPHAALESDQWLERIGARVPCVACHGDVAAHIQAGGGQGSVFAFIGEPNAEQQGRCLECHADSHPRFEQSPHANAGLTCTDCHSVHHSADGSGPLLRPAAAGDLGIANLRPRTRICVDCHRDIYALFAANERHRLPEGVLECVSCHDPHEPQSRQLLGGFKQEICGSCHADKLGPFVYEHPASRVESCTVCHSPHGSPNRHLLAHQQVAELCLSCHATVPQFHLGFNPAAASRFGTDTQCTNCHSSIHGSNFDSHFLR